MRNARVQYHAVNPDVMRAGQGPWARPPEPQKKSLTPVPKQKDKWSDWGPLFDAHSTPCCGVQILHNFFGYIILDDDFVFQWRKQGGKPHTYGSMVHFYVDHDGLRQASPFPDDADVCLAHDLEMMDAHPALKKSSHLIITLRKDERDCIERVILASGYRRVVTDARSDRTKSLLSTYIKVLHPTKDFDHFKLDTAF